MRGRLFFVCFLFTLPLLAALGHDIYFAYNNNETGISIDEPFKLTDITWMLVTYAPDFYDWLRESVSQSTWQNILVPLMSQKTAFIAAIPAVLLYGFLIIAKFGGFWPFSDKPLFQRDDRKKGYAFKGEGINKKRDQMRYKRK